MLLSPIDKAFLTNIFDDVEAVADCFGVISIAHQPKSNKRETMVIILKYALFYCFKVLFKQSKVSIKNNIETK